MADELSNFAKISLYEEVPCPHNRKVIDSKWVYKIKRGPNGDVKKYKAHLVAKGFTQVYGVDYMETFAPVAKFSTICFLLALAAQHDLEIHQMDVKSAFLNGKLEEEIYLQPPPGLKQAPKAWYTRLREVFKSLGFTRSYADHSLFFKVEDGTLIIVTVYVDDKLILSKSCEAIDWLKKQLSAEYDLSDLGEAHWILSMEIIQDRDKGTIELSQRHYIEIILEHMGMQDGHTVATPIELNLKLKKLDSPECNLKSYQSGLGALMYAMLAICPNLAFTVGILSRHAASPGDHHLLALKRAH
ncbi:hypothetical protein PISMIDRAFT_18456 [Pisolithus microcarpus 441]|uniref:Reverse transcriptase Ty1/copia-type domain-containing protein n=1 Tax=Pisolithus microcarpus 441 TaxID=765257 RepID=A0A0C9XKF8_9AGAM|nr:hypothetical protein PISMIDRAFT_18456 [Pisolithus microcarpus 441]